MSQTTYRGVAYTIQNDTQSVPQTILTYRGVDYRPNTEINQPSGERTYRGVSYQAGVNLEVEHVRKNINRTLHFIGAQKISGIGDWSLIVCEGRGYTPPFLVYTVK